MLTCDDLYFLQYKCKRKKLTNHIEDMHLWERIAITYKDKSIKSCMPTHFTYEYTKVTSKIK